MKIAIVGSGISGLTAAYYLSTRHEVTVFEADGRVGGHANTMEVESECGAIPIDTGFIVYNDRNYPGFSALLRKLQVETCAASMSFSVSCGRTGIEYCGRDLGGLFAQRGNAASPRFLRMISEVLRFNRQAERDVQSRPSTLTLGAYLDEAGFGGLFRSHYLIPMAAAIWSAPPSAIESFPAQLFVQFFRNHGLLTVNEQPQWRSVIGGSRSYVQKLCEPFRKRIRLNCGVQSLVRTTDHVVVSSAAGTELFDQVVVASHSDQALAILADPSRSEREVLGALPYQRNEVLLHDDLGQLPANRRAWAAWNYRIPDRGAELPHVTYCMNLLQRLGVAKTYCVTLNGCERIPTERHIARFRYDHPVYTPESQRARERRHEINGTMRTWYCGAYWGYGFHEDGYRSAAEVAQRIDASALKAA